MFAFLIKHTSYVYIYGNIKTLFLRNENFINGVNIFMLHEGGGSIDVQLIFLKILGEIE